MTCRNRTCRAGPGLCRFAGVFVISWLQMGAAWSAAPTQFRRGDSNGDEILDTSDAITLLSHLFSNSTPLRCADAADANDDGRVDLSDAVHVLVFLLSGGPPPRAPWPRPGEDPTPDELGCELAGGLPADPQVELLVHLTNMERQGQGLPPLKSSPLLEEAMSGHLEDMAAHGFFGHVSLDGGILPERLEEVGYNWQTAGENIAAGYQTARVVLEAWLASPSHRANLFHPAYREIGVARLEDDSSAFRIYWGQDFGARRNVYPIIIEGEAPETSRREVSLFLHGEGWAEEFRLANEEGLAGAPWRPFRARLDWVLSEGAGLKTVHAELRKGGVVLATEDTIRLR